MDVSSSASNTPRRVGFAGIGNMGNPMAAHIARAGFELTVYDIKAEAAQIFAERHGARVASSPAELGAHSDALITMLPGGEVVRDVMLGNNGAAGTLSRGSVLIDMSSADPMATRALAADLAPRGIYVVDAPVMGGVVFARDATLDIMAAGDAEVVTRVTPLLKCMGRSMMNCGAVGNGHALKALANYINACAMINVVEAMSIGKKFGLDTKFMGDALLPMINGRQHPLEKKVIPQILTRDFNTGMTMGLIAKDIGIALDTARALDAHAPLAGLTHALWTEAVQKFGGHVDHTMVAKLWEQATGVTLANGE